MTQISEQVRQLIAAVDKESPPVPDVPRLYAIAAVSPEGNQVARWEMNRPHPLSPKDMTVLRMYLRPGGVKIYSISNDGTAGVMNFLPIDKVIFTAFIMDQQALLDELDACEAGEDEDPGDPGDAPPEGEEGTDAPETTADTAPANGQAAP